MDDADIYLIDETSSTVSVLTQVAFVLEESIDDDGWDRPATLWCLESIAGARNVAGIRSLGEFAGHPANALIGRRAPDGVTAVLLATEAWAYPDYANDYSGGDNPNLAVLPADHPDRQELRCVTAMAPSGHWAQVTRLRGGEPQVRFTSDTTSAAAGRMQHHLRCYVGAPHLGDQPSARDGAAQILIAEAYDFLLGETVKQGGSDAAFDDLGEMLAVLVLGITGRMDGSTDLVREVIETARAQLPPAVTTWDDMRRTALDSTSDPDTRRLLQWIDGPGFCDHFLGLGTVEPKGDILVAAVPQRRRQAVAEALRSLGMRVSRRD